MWGVSFLADETGREVGVGEDGESMFGSSLRYGFAEDLARDGVIVAGIMSLRFQGEVTCRRR